MNGTEQRSLRDTAAAPSRPLRNRLSTSTGDDLRVSSARDADRFPSASVPHGPALSTSGDHTLSSSIAISSDTASVSLETSSAAISGPAPPILAATANASPREMPPLLWWDAPSSLLAEDPTGGDAFSFNAGGGGATAAAAGGPAASSSLLPSEWHCSIDFSHEIESRAEAELQQLWTTLWCATHSMEALTAALQGPRTQWNPYRPARGGPEVREEVLNSEVAEFKEMVTVDSLCLRGTAVKLEKVSAPDGFTSTATTSPHRPSQKSKKGRGAVETQKSEKDGETEEVLMVGRSSAELHPLAQPAAGADAHYTEAWWAAHRSDAEAALFAYLWETVFVPFYTSAPGFVSSAPFPSLRLASTAAVNTSTSLTFTRVEERDEKDASGTVTAFWPAREEKRSWALESGLRSSSPSCVLTPPSADDGDKESRPPSPLARTQRSGCGLPLHPTQDFQVFSDDSLEVEVLDETNGGGAAAASAASAAQHNPAMPGREHTASPSRRSTTRIAPRRHERPSTAGVKGAVLTPIEDIPLGMPIPVSRNGAALAAKQRARSARADDAARLTTEATTDLSLNPAQPVGDGRGWRWTKTPTVHTAVAVSPKQASVTRQRPPTAQPPLSKSRRVASPNASAWNAALLPARGDLSGGTADAVGRATTSAKTSAATRATPRSTAGVAEPCRGTSPPKRTKTTGSSSQGTQRPPRQLNSSANAAVNHALQLLELKSRSTSRSPFALRVPSPFTRSSTAESGGGAEVLCKGRKHRASLQLDGSSGTSEVKGPHRHRQLFPVTAMPPHEKHRQQVRGSVGDKGRDATPVTHSGARAAGQQQKERRTPVTRDLDEPERLAAPKTRPTLLREAVAHSPTPQTQPAALPDTQRCTSALGRTPSVKSRRQGKGPQSAFSPDKKNTGFQRPTTAHK